MGAAYAAGEISRAHVDVAVGVHRRLRAGVREQVLPVTDPDTGEVREERCIRVVDAALAAHARGYTVPEFARIADRIVQTWTRPGPGTRTAAATCTCPGSRTGPCSAGSPAAPPKP